MVQSDWVPQGVSRHVSARWQLPAVTGDVMLRCAWCTTEETSGRQYAMKRMRKSAVVQCPEHVFCEQAITCNTAHPFCIRQYASFQVCPGTTLLPFTQL